MLLELKLSEIDDALLLLVCSFHEAQLSESKLVASTFMYHISYRHSSGPIHSKLAKRRAWLKVGLIGAESDAERLIGSFWNVTFNVLVLESAVTRKGNPICCPMIFISGTMQLF
ncbi:hypothetical protein PGT21_008636 [Puccinia graminis f. sp. tritici]|uniref:Uncharacterized protein n=1 Tax=Puccinia graminis f. sp. tritici TaxID=56615 RepID=A0A5B0MN67_PUCGR|nr:hypothetical protein PGT21_008636 [Puccinia graminis f. sp. tritici]